MKSFREFLVEANLSGIHERSGKTKLDYYVLDSDVNSIEYSIEKDTKLIGSIKDNDTKGSLTKGDLVTILSKNLVRKSTSTYIQVYSKEHGTGFVTLSAIRKPTGERTFNRGDISEGIIAAAAATKFSLSPKDITVQDVFNTIDNLNGKNELTLMNGKDTIQLIIKLKPASYDAFVSKKYRADLLDEYQGAVKYVNSKNITRYADMLRNNETADTIVVIADGTSDEKGTKIDMNILVGLDGNTPRKVKNLSLSLKSGNTKTMAQIGTKLDRVVSFWEGFGISINPDNYEKTEDWFSNLFKEVVIDINKKLGTDVKEKAYLQTLVKGIQHAATGGDDSVTVLHINKGYFTTHSFKNLDRKLKDINLKAILHETSKRPEINIIDSTTNEKLLGFRLEVRDAGKTLKIHVEKGSLLNKLTSTSKENE